MLMASKNVPLTIPLHHGGPRNDVDVVFVSPDGSESMIPAFWAGDGRLYVRFAASAEGRHRYRTRSDDLALDGLAGDIDVIPYTGDNPLFVHGRLRVARSGRTLEHLDETPFFWLGDTWWMGLSPRLGWPNDFAHLTADRVEKGFSVIQIVCGPLPSFPSTPEGIWNPQQANEGGLPWDRDWECLNPNFYDFADRRIDHLVKNGLVPCIVATWGYYLTLMGEDRVKQMWRHLVARYAAYPVVFCLAGEVKLPPYDLEDPAARERSTVEQQAGWSRIGHYVRRLDCYHNPVTIHPVFPDGRSSIDDESVLDINMLQTGHYTYQRNSAEEAEQIRAMLHLDEPVEFSFAATIAIESNAVARRPIMPVVDGEPAYEGINGSNWQDVVRFTFWTGMLAGLAGQTYGAQGLWQMSSVHEPYDPLTWINWGYGFWEEAMHYPGSRQVGLGRQILERFNWWQLTPRSEPDAQAAGRVSAFGAEIPNQAALFYLPGMSFEGRLRGVRGLRLALDAGTTYRASYVDVRNGTELSLGLVFTDSEGWWRCPEPPTREDWLLILSVASAGL